MVGFLDFGANPLWINLLIFGAGAAAIWYAGTKLERSVDEISERTGLGKAFAGLLLLAGATSLPEMATTVTASMNGNAALAVNNLMGGISMQTAVLAVADWTLAKGALTFFTPRYTLLLQGVALVLLIGVAIAAMVIGEVFSIWGIGLWPTLLFAIYLLLLYQTHRLRGNPRWQVTNGENRSEDAGHAESDQARNREPEPKEKGKRTLGRIYAGFGILCAVVLAAGWMVAEVADVLTGQLGLSASFVGAVLVAISTSLPELSTTTAAVRNGNYSMAVSNIFGTNMMEVALLFVAGLFYRKGSIIVGGGQEAIFTASLGLIVTCVYLWGLLERRDRTVLRLGVDSAIVLFLYLGGIILLYRMG